MIDTLLSLRDAWHWVQVGFCAALGASLIFAPFAAMSRGTPAPEAPEYPDPHCSHCCPNFENDDF
jgi:hypothetical protein